MKKIVMALVAFMLVIGTTQCKKEQPNNAATTDEGELVYISLKVNDDGAKHIVYPNTGAVVYSDGDVIYVGNNGHYVGSLTYANGTFSGTITSPSTSDYLHFYFVGGLNPSATPTAGTTTSFTVSIADQSSKLPVLSYGRSNIKYVDGTTTYTCMLENKCGLVKFVPSEATIKTISVTGMKTTATIDFATPGIMPTDATGEVTLYSANAAEKWAILLPQDVVENPTVNLKHWIGTITSVPVVTPNMYYNTGVGISMISGIIKEGVFSVSETKQVYFSQGNLQYIGSSSPSYWKFAENQWEYFGISTGYNSKNENDNHDLFSWGTSGYNHGAMCYQPWERTTNSDGYNAYGGGYHLYQQTGQADWGYNAIDNGGNTEGLWRALTSGEWSYLVDYRNTLSNMRYAKAVVNNVNGLILLPDNWNASTFPL